jgi:hypothetical protein
MIRKLVLLGALGAVTAVLAGCGKGEKVDEYTKASLKEATYGEVVSEGFKYKIVTPQVLDTLGSYVVVRQGNLTLFVTGNNIAQQVGRLGDMQKLTFNVVKRFKPMVYMQCMSIVSATDSLVVEHEKPIALPRTSEAGSFTPPADYTRIDMTELRYDDTLDLKERIGKKFSTRARLVRVDTDSTDFWMIEGEKPCPSPFFRQEERVVPAMLRVKNPRPSLEIVLRMLSRTDQMFDGGFTFVGVEPYPARADNQLCGTIEIGYVRFLDTVFMR